MKIIVICNKKIFMIYYPIPEDIKFFFCFQKLKEDLLPEGFDPAYDKS